MRLTLRKYDFDEWSIWVSLQPHEQEGWPAVEDQSESFIVGTGKTREFAIADAGTNLEDAIRRLQTPSMREGKSR